MALLSASNRVFVLAGVLRALASSNIDLTTVQADVLAAVNAADGWVDANAVSYNAALPEPFRTWSTPGQKVLLLIYVVMRRYNVGA